MEEMSFFSYILSEIIWQIQYTKIDLTDLSDTILIRK